MTGVWVFSLADMNYSTKELEGKEISKILKSRSPEYLLKAMIDAEGEDIEVNSDKCQFTQF